MIYEQYFKNTASFVTYSSDLEFLLLIVMTVKAAELRSTSYHTNCIINIRIAMNDIREFGTLRTKIQLKYNVL